jgi:quercetin dioxygenase-like cupin family protein
VQTKENPQMPSEYAPVKFLKAGDDHYGELRSLGVSKIDFKVVPQNSHDLLIIENVFHAPGGPARHLHYEQEEWFYILEGQFVMEGGQEQRILQPGDSVVAPRQVPHVWAHIGKDLGRILIAFMPAGKMEAFFRAVARENAMPPQDPTVWHAHGMQLLGPPLPAE